MGQYGVSWRAWAVLVCLQVAACCVDAAGLHQSVGVAKQQVQNAPGRFLDSLFEDDDGDRGDGDASDVMGRGKKKFKKMKYVLAVLVGAIVVKGIFIPLAIKAVALLAKKALLLSSLSLILSAIIGFKKIAHAGWDRMGQMMMMKEPGEVTDIPYLPTPAETMYHKISTDHYWGRDFKSN